MITVTKMLISGENMDSLVFSVHVGLLDVWGVHVPQLFSCRRYDSVVSRGLEVRKLKGPEVV